MLQPRSSGRQGRPAPGAYHCGSSIRPRTGHSREPRAQIQLLSRFLQGKRSAAAYLPRNRSQQGKQGTQLGWCNQEVLLLEFGSDHWHPRCKKHQQGRPRWPHSLHRGSICLLDRASIERRCRDRLSCSGCMCLLGRVLQQQNQQDSICCLDKESVQRPEPRRSIQQDRLGTPRGLHVGRSFLQDKQPRGHPHRNAQPRRVGQWIHQWA